MIIGNDNLGNYEMMMMMFVDDGGAWLLLYGNAPNGLYKELFEISLYRHHPGRRQCHHPHPHHHPH